MSCCPSDTEVAAGCGCVCDTSGPPVLACFNREDIHASWFPYPDEVILSLLDNLLYFAGATKIVHLWNLAKLGTTISLGGSLSKEQLPPTQRASATTLYSIKAPSSRSSWSKFATARNSIKSCLSASKAASMYLSSSSPKPSGSCVSLRKPIACCSSKSTSFKPNCIGVPPPSRPRTPRVDFANPVSEFSRIQGGSGTGPPMRLRKMLADCCPSCQRIKAKINSTLPSHANGQKWLWTRFVNTDNGCKVYEVYKNSDVERSPTQLAGNKEPVIYFLVMPTGHILPFETVSSL
ncbi:uncharacterized protein LOC108597536 [Drosophila busckii]|uniref:uncharacterized protein LOC108597536 n=1 Tax=Drosophila busckii TaxID=30019 RepID=UPI00083EFE0A|nr:uncharacterized protein LOC108597536 [Drosophila busckii]